MPVVPPEPKTTAVVALTIPADPRYLRIARLVVAGLGADADLTVDTIDDLRVAVDEVGALLIEADGDDEIAIAFETADGQITIRAARSASTSVPELHPVSRGLLNATTDELDVSLSDTGLEVVASRGLAPRS